MYHMGNAELKEIHIGLRITQQQKGKLEVLSQETGRSISAILRLLIDKATATHQPDIVLEGEGD